MEETFSFLSLLWLLSCLSLSIHLVPGIGKIVIDLIQDMVRCIWPYYLSRRILTHCGRVTHICVSKLTIIGSDNGLSPVRRQAIICTNAGMLLIEPLGTNFSEILIGIQIFSFTKIRLKMSSAKWRPFCLGPNVLRAAVISSMPICCCMEAEGVSFLSLVPQMQRIIARSFRLIHFRVIWSRV